MLGLFALIRGRGLKLVRDDLIEASKTFALIRGRGLKPLVATLANSSLVRPHTGARIETVINYLISEGWGSPSYGGAD